jgi:hypothetical protein
MVVGKSVVICNQSGMYGVISLSSACRPRMPFFANIIASGDALQQKKTAKHINSADGIVRVEKNEG